MSKKWSNEDIAWKVEDEGLEYMIMSYLNADSIEDEELKKLWATAGETLDKIKEILDSYNTYDDEE